MKVKFIFRNGSSFSYFFQRKHCLSVPSHGIVTKTVYKTLPGGWGWNLGGGGLGVVGMRHWFGGGLGGMGGVSKCHSADLNSKTFAAL